MDNHCATCGAYLADTGRMVCPECEKPKKAELKPCPFCGGEVGKPYYCNSLESFRTRTSDGCYIIACHGCRVGMSKHTTEAVIESWNRRAEDGK